MFFARVTKLADVPTAPHHSKTWVDQKWTIAHMRSGKGHAVMMLDFRETFKIKSTTPLETVFVSDGESPLRITVTIAYLKPTLTVVKRPREAVEEKESTKIEYETIGSNDYGFIADDKPMYALVSAKDVRHEFDFTPHGESLVDKTKRFVNSLFVF